jgi:Cys-rich protein (TIGR01571 family)
MDPPASQSWNEGLCACTHDLPICALSFLCPCVQYGRTEEALKGSAASGHCCFYAVCCLICHPCVRSVAHRVYRGHLRRVYGIDGDRCTDCLVTFLCPCCAVAQDARELKSRGPPPRQSMGAEHSAGLELADAGKQATGAEVVRDEFHRVFVRQPMHATKVVLGVEKRQTPSLAEQET